MNFQEFPAICFMDFQEYTYINIQGIQRISLKYFANFHEFPVNTMFFALLLCLADILFVTLLSLYLNSIKTKKKF